MCLNLCPGIPLLGIYYKRLRQVLGKDHVEDILTVFIIVKLGKNLNVFVSLLFLLFSVIIIS